MTLKTLTSLFILIATSAAYSQSKGFQFFEENTAAFVYIDNLNYKKSNGVVDVEIYLDFKNARKNNKGEYFNSMQSRYQIDCRNKTESILTASVFEGGGLTGRNLYSGKLPREVRTIQPGSSSESIYKKFC